MAEKITYQDKQTAENPESPVVPIEVFLAADANEIKDKFNELVDEVALEEEIVSDVAFGATPVGTVFPDGMTFTEYVKIKETLVISPTITDPSFELVNNAGFMEIGSITPFTLLFNFYRGNISEYWHGINKPRAGASIGYAIKGVSQAGNSLLVNDYTVLQGTNSFNGTVSYGAGPQPIDNQGDNYSSPYPAGTSAVKTTSFTGKYPIFYYKSNSPISASAMAIAIASGLATKILANSEDSVIIPFNAEGEYIATAIVNSSPTKNTWYVNALDNGAIPGGLFNSPVMTEVDSPDGYWENINYKVYSSAGLITQSNPIQLRN